MANLDFDVAAKAGIYPAFDANVPLEIVKFVRVGSHVASNGMMCDKYRIHFKSGEFDLTGRDNICMYHLLDKDEWNTDFIVLEEMRFPNCLVEIACTLVSETSPQFTSLPVEEEIETDDALYEEVANACAKIKLQKPVK